MVDAAAVVLPRMLYHRESLFVDFNDSHSLPVLSVVLGATGEFTLVTRTITDGTPVAAVAWPAYPDDKRTTYTATMSTCFSGSGTSASLDGADTDRVWDGIMAPVTAEGTHNVVAYKSFALSTTFTVVPGPT